MHRPPARQRQSAQRREPQHGLLRWSMLGHTPAFWHLGRANEQGASRASNADAKPACALAPESAGVAELPESHGKPRRRPPHRDVRRSSPRPTATLPTRLRNRCTPVATGHGHTPNASYPTIDDALSLGRVRRRRGRDICVGPFTVSGRQLTSGLAGCSAAPFALRRRRTCLASSSRWFRAWPDGNASRSRSIRLGSRTGALSRLSGSTRWRSVWRRRTLRHPTRRRRAPYPKRWRLDRMIALPSEQAARRDWLRSSRRA